ncbi:hypothetical protein GLOTRDRAFT_116298 [Gloeophyllum trabeum ATCC 11539]|uniref:FAD-binding PCMH-type domain-containing protein n=1 Tax=Gloeophyllum trabeum (strain ATCC 11539 / FP-39264 / Madison 617) TaxID=670483 RepID=S7RR56_GLOTA|nr:uncharacterized protein GLOTRDRAFT_116298 [Gloeophyllum trabeum ATCC 11539]EPQ55404.1 hypothetical protein GLOTRDRAFT_116298 [Gloeophyllum trabeum ATCC 11539]
MQDGEGWYSELCDSVRGGVYRRGEPSFNSRSQIFNGNVQCHAKAVTCPVDAQDVSSILKICIKHSLSPSVKAGGYGTAGWAVNGDVIIDLSNLLDIHIAPPLQNPVEIEDSGLWKDYTSIRDMPVTSSKGKSAVADPIANPLKRRRQGEDEDEYENPARKQRSYDHASPALASFLRGPALPPDPLGEEPRRPPLDIRGDRNLETLPMTTRQISGESNKSETSMTSSQSGSNSSLVASSSGGTDFTSPDGSIDLDSPNKAADPFSYMTSTSSVDIQGAGESSGVRGLAGNLPPLFVGGSQSPAFAMPGAWPRSGSDISTPTGPMSGMTLGVGSSSTADPFGYMNPAGPPSGSSLLGSFGPGTSSLWLPPSALQNPFSGPSDDSAILSDPTLNTPLRRAAEVSHRTHAVPVHKHAYVTFGAGVMQKDMDAFTHRNPLEGRSVGGSRVDVPYHVPSAAHPVGSSIMLLGGFGFISRLYGLSVDNVVEMEVVLADGTIVVADRDSHPDLWWALRGAGPAFGIVTRYKAKAYPVPVVFAGNLIYRFHRATAPSLIRHFRDCIKSVPRELYANVLLTAGPADKDSLVVIQFCYVGVREKGLEFLQAIESWEGETCLLNEVSEKAFIDQQDSVAQVLRAKAGRNWFIRSALISSLPDEIINKTVMQFADTPIGCTWLFELAGGAIADFEDTCIAKSQREATWTVAALHQWELEIDDPRCRTSAEKWINQTLAPVSVGGSFPSFLGRHEPASRTISCFGENWNRLCELKQKYDPHNIFRNTFWPLDEGGIPIDPESHEPPSP